MKKFISGLTISLLVCSGVFADTPTPTPTVTPTFTATYTRTKVPSLTATFTKTPLPAAPVNNDARASIRFTAGANVSAGKFVGFDDKTTGSGGRMKCVSMTAVASGVAGYCIVSGPAEVLAGGTLYLGDPVKSDSSGNAVLAGSSDWIAGYVVAKRSSGGTTVVTISLSPPAPAFATVTPSPTPS